MTAPSTLPIPRPLPRVDRHEHAWLVESRHATSEGVVTYVRCAECAVRRVDLQSHPQMPPTALSTEVSARR